MALVILLDESDGKDWLLKAEALRELGDFGDAKSILGKHLFGKWACIVRQLLTLCERQDTPVGKLDIAVELVSGNARPI